jgi:CRISPR-associated protein Cas5h
MMPIVAFNLWGDYAHFRKYYTTTSPLTFSLPPRTALMGIIGAICGLKKESYLAALAHESIGVAVSLINPVAKVRIAENLINTKIAPLMARIPSQSGHIQVRFELLKNPCYRVYVSLKDAALQSTLKEMLAAHRCVYTPYLGISELIANFCFIGEYEAEAITPDDYVNIRSAVNSDAIRDLSIEEGKEYFSEVVPCDMADDRVVTRFSKIVYERTAQPIRAMVTECLDIGTGEYLAFL